MSEQLRKRDRLLQFRSIQHRMAMIKVAEATAEVTNLLNVGSRIDVLRAKLGSNPGNGNGQSMQAVSEMADRLDNAALGLSQPIAHAEAVLEDKRAMRVHAHNSEKGATKLRDAAATDAARSRELRADANRPFRRIPRNGAST